MRADVVGQRHLGHVAQVLHQVLAAVRVGCCQDCSDAEEEQRPRERATAISWLVLNQGLS